MNISEETLMAFADGELDEQGRFEVELAMRHDPVVAEKVRSHMALRSSVFKAYVSTLDEAVPQRLQAATGKSAKVVQLDSVRQLRTPPPPVAAPAKRRLASIAWPQWGALAATLVLGVLIGGTGVGSLGAGAQLATIDAGSGALAAQGALAQALSQQLASAPAASSGVALGVSFMDQDGNYCRSFKLAKSAGLACQSGGEWRIAVLSDSAAGAPGAAGAYRQAGAAMPAAVLEAIDARISGTTLDAAAEKAAMLRGWNP